VYHALRGDRDTYDLHIQADGSAHHQGKQIEKRRVLQSNATVFNALHKQSAAHLSKTAKQFGTKHTGNSHLHFAEMNNQHVRRKILRKHSITTIPHWKLTKQDKGSDATVGRAIRQDISYPVIVTPLPSSFAQDSVVVETKDELEDVLESIFKYQQKAHIQSGVQGQVYSGLVMPEFRTQKPYTFPPFEKNLDSRLANAAQKDHESYQSVHDRRTKPLQSKIKQVFQALNLHCLTRIDLAESREGNWYVLHVETHPRLDRHSLLADAANRIGVLMKDVFTKQVEIARKR
jgi:D-alanine-D-alanine ligase-like ATP-grasp enzyme